MVYLPWKKHLHPSIELIPVELSGRGSRFATPFYESFDAAINDIYDLIQKKIENSRYALLGHSMGSWLVYELAYMIAERNQSQPVHLFLSGRYPPYLQKEMKISHDLPEAELKAQLMEMGGTPVELLENDEFLNLFMPVLRADYKILETYQYSPKSYQLGCAITSFTGSQDEIVTIEELQLWQESSSQVCRSYELEGGHFFLHEKTSEIARIINDTLVVG